MKNIKNPEARVLSGGGLTTDSMLLDFALCNLDFAMR